MNFTTLLKIGENLTENSTFAERAIVGAQVVAIGMGVVFGVLIILIGILQLFKLFFAEKPKKSKTPEVTAAPSSAPAVSAVPDSDDDTVVAVVSAAIAASRGKSDVDFTILSIAPIGGTPAPAVSAPVEKAEKKEETVVAEPVKAAAPIAAGEGEKVCAPLPGNILDVKVSNGASVKKGDILCILEAMKMENEIVAPKDGTINTVAATKGSSVNTGDLLFVIG